MMDSNENGVIENNGGTYEARNRYGGTSHGSNQSSVQLHDYPSSRAETPIDDYIPATPHARSTSETLILFQSAVESSRAAAIKNNAESEAMESSISLNVDLKNQNISVLPDEVVDVMKKDQSRIIGLILSGNFIRNLPPRLSECSQLTYLNLRSNSLSDFPPVILTLSKLEVLDVSRNSLSSIPEEIQKMKRLRFLSIRNNRLIGLPKSLGFADHLRVIKLDGNPLSESLWKIVNATPPPNSSSPQANAMNENDVAVHITQEIKKSLRDSSTQTTDSEFGSQSESPLETPRPSKRNSARFPVKLANGSSSETGFEPRSPSLSKAQISTRPKQRLFSGSNGISRVALRPGVAPLNLGNERNRSQSESIVQATANARNKRMGILSAKRLDSLEESAVNRNSLHLRGTSHASALRDRHRIYTSALGSESSNSISPVDELGSGGIFLRRLSSVPERRVESMTSRRIIAMARGLVYSLHMFDPNLHILLGIIDTDSSPGRFSIGQKYHQAIGMIKKLDRDLSSFDSHPPNSAKSQKKATRLIKDSSFACLRLYKEIFACIDERVSQLLHTVDRKYLRTFMLVFYGSCNEAYNASLLAAPEAGEEQAYTMVSSRPFQVQKPPRLTIQAAGTGRSGMTVRRLRSDTVNAGRSGVPTKPLPAMSTSSSMAVNYVRSRSNSRTSQMGAALARTPREPFLLPQSPHPVNPQDFESGELERIYASISDTIEQCFNKMSELISRNQLRLNSFHDRRDREACQRIIGRFRSLKNTCEDIWKRMGAIKLNDPDGSRFKSLCAAFLSCTEEWEGLVTSMAAERRAFPQIWSAEDMKSLKPLHNQHKRSAAAAQNHLSRPMISQPDWRATGIGGSGGLRQHGHERGGRGDSNGSINSPYVPTTPLSAALGPAAQATIPAAANAPAMAVSSPSGFEGTVRGNWVARADALLSTNPALPFLRPRERAL